ncbi:MAG: ATP-binding cassette domain-containing protein [Lachnospiraceae bacterium]|nr:ATP-binding cassette domain-containing protein [Lachnospiraceae bacterium]
MFINKYLIALAGENTKGVLKAGMYELLTVLLGTWISFCSALIIQNLMNTGTIAGNKVEMVWIFIGIAAGLLLRFRIAGKKVRVANQCSVQIRASLREKLCGKMFELGPAFMSANRTGDIADTISNKVEALSYYYSTYLPASMAAILNAACLIIMIFFMDKLTAFICLGAFIGMILCPMTFYQFMKERGEKEWEAHSDYYADCLDSIQGMTALKSFHANEQRRDYIHQTGETLRIRVMEHLRITMLENGVLELLTRMGSTFSVAVAAVHIVSSGKHQELLVYILFLVSACFSPMMKLADAWHMGYRGITASYSIMELLGRKGTLTLQAVSDGRDFAAAATGTGTETVSISLRNVSFAYDREEGDVLHNITFTVRPGTMTALVGASGSGKSTIAHLLAGFYPAGTGTVLVGDRQMSETTVGEIQSLISAVWQDSHIFYGTVEDNIRIGRMDASDEEIVDAARRANIHEFIMTLPNGYATVLGENGMRFSGGERQRIAIARAFLKDSPVLLFDEATSSLDRKNEIEVQQSFIKLKEGKTAVVIAHRLATIEKADQICILENGRISDSGTHGELAEKSGVYRQLMGKQMYAQEVGYAE